MNNNTKNHNNPIVSVSTIWKNITVFLFAVAILSSCSNNQVKKELTQLEEGKKSAKGITLQYPFDGTIFPPEIPSPLFEWNKTPVSSDLWNIFITNESGKVLMTGESKVNSWRPDSVAWEKLKKLDDSNNLYFTAIGNKSVSGNLPSCRIKFSISDDPVGAEIFYRAVTLPFSYAVKNVNTIEWYMGNVNGTKPRKMLDNLPVCGNCHSFAKEKPLLAMDIDYGNDKGSYAIATAVDTCRLKPENIITWSSYKKEENDPTYGLLSQISPDGNHVLSTVKDLSVFVAVDNNMAYSQLFFPIKGVIGIYNRNNNTFDVLNGANDQKYVQSNPTWSPDGKKVIFARTEAYVSEKVKNAGRALLALSDVDEFTSGGKQFKYDLYAVDFNNGKGGESKPLKGASNNGKSNYFPKFSPDGKWIVFCQADNFMLLQPDSRLYIMPAEGGEPRLMNCNTKEMNSWHSWSPNGRWLVFSSKSRGLYTQLYLTHIDENGMDSPPVLLENLCFDKRAANIPEFVPFNTENFKQITDEFSRTVQHFNFIAFDAITNKFYKRALANLNEAFKIDSNHLETYTNKLMLNAILRQSTSKEEFAISKKALSLVNNLLQKNPDNENYISMKITLLSNLKRYDEALQETNRAIERFPNSYKLYDQLSSVYRKQNQYEKAIQCYQKMIKLDASKKKQLNNLISRAYIKLGKNNEALQIVNQMLSNQPSDLDLLYARAQILMGNKNFDLAKKDAELIFSKDSTNYTYNQLLAQLYAGEGNKRLSYFYANKAIQLLNQQSNSNPEDVDALFELASLYLSARDFKNADEKYNLVLNNFPNNYEALKQKAKIKLNTQLWNDAIAIYEQLEKYYLPEEEFYNNRAIAYIQTGNYQMALANFNKTIEINPNNKDAVYNRDKLKQDIGRNR